MTLSKIYLPIFFSFLILLSASAQNNGSLEICNEDACGSVLVSYTPSGDNVFCENSTITLKNNSSTTDFEFFFIDWGDGIIDTVFDYENASHTYNFQNIDRCETGSRFNQFISYVGFKTCGNGTSCHWNQTLVSVRVKPVAQIGLPPELCISESLIPQNNSCNGEFYEWDFGDGITSDEESPIHQYNSPGEYTVVLKVTNSCGSNSTSRVIKVVGEPIANFETPMENLCAPSTIDLIDNANEFSNTVWSILPNDTLKWCFTDTSQNLTTNDININFKQPGEYVIMQTASNVCGTDNMEVILTLGQAPIANISSPPQGCESLTLSSADLNPQFSEDITGISWTFINGTPSTATGRDFSNITFTENGKIIVEVSNDCGEGGDSIDVIVFQQQQPTIETLPSTVCSGSSPISLSADIEGGTWSGPGVIEGTPTFDPSTVSPGQSYTITYTVGNEACSFSDQVEILVVASASISITPPPIFCEDSTPQALMALPDNGSWEGDHIETLTGEYNPQAAGVGLDTVYYTLIDENGCQVSAEVILEIESFPVISGEKTLDLCIADQDINLLERLNLEATPGEGVFSWGGPGIINPNEGIFNAVQAGLTPETYTIYFTYLRNQCAVQDSINITLIEPQPLVLGPLDMTICISESTFQLSTNLEGGNWQGPGVDPVSGLIDLENAGGGSATYTYAYEPGTTCAQNGTVVLEIIDVGAELEAGPDVAICEGSDSTFRLSGQSPTNGVWEGEHLVDPQMGIIDLTLLVLDSLYTYNYCLESQAVEGCSACDSRTLILQSKPDPSFEIDGTACINETFSLLSNSADPNISCIWDLGNGETRMNCEPTYSYIIPGNYTITHSVVNLAGCTALDTLNLYITEPPSVSFVPEEKEGCAPFELNLINNSTGDNISSAWFIANDTIFGDLPNTITLDSITKDSFFHILLEVSNLCGTVSAEDSVLVHPYPITEIGLDVDDGCSPLTLSLANPTIGNPNTFFWDLGNGITSSDSLPSNPTYTTFQNEVSTYEISLIASNECGTDTAYRTVTVFPPDVQAFIGLDTIAGCAPYIFEPNSFSTPGSFLDWSIYDPNGNQTGSSNSPNPSFLLNIPGAYLVVLEAARCGSDRDTAMLTVLAAPIPSFDAPRTACLGEAILFENTSQDISSVFWDFGDGQTSDELNPTHEYDSAGLFIVTLTVFSEITNCPATTSREIEINDLPSSNFNLSDSTGCLPLTITFTNQSANAATYLWNFGHEGHTSSAVNPVFTFEEAGNFIIYLVAQDGNSCFSDTTFETITVYARPRAEFEILNDRFCHGHDSLIIRNTSSLDALEFKWDIAGTEYTNFEPVHWMEQAGSASVFLVAENINGCRDSNSQIISYLPSPEATFTTDLVAGCPPLAVNFTNNTTNADGFQWVFADGNTANTFDTSNTFQNAGQYRVTLIAQNSNACPIDTSQQIITVYPEPNTDFSFTQQDTCGTPARVQFNSNTVGETDLAWLFGDGISSALPSPEHIYTVPDIYQVSLKAINEFGCEHTRTKEIIVNGNPMASFELLATKGCAPFMLDIRNTSREALDFTWYLNGELVSEESTPEITIPEVGTYDLRLVAKYGDQCIDILDSLNVVKAFLSPTANFTAFPDESAQLKGEVRFVNESNNANRFLWNLGDGTQSTAFELEHEYDINGPIEVVLSAYQDNNGEFTCVDSISQVISPEFIGTFYAHNAMSPEYGEEIHRVFKPVGLGIVEYDLILYSPWGEQIWRTRKLEDTQPSEAWDGYYRGKLVQQGVYVWQASVVFANGVKKVYEGELHILR